MKMIENKNEGCIICRGPIQILLLNYSILENNGKSHLACLDGNSLFTMNRNCKDEATGRILQKYQ